MNNRCWGWSVLFTLFCLPLYAEPQEDLLAGTLALEKQKHTQAIDLFSKVIDDSDTSQSHRLAAYAGRCAAHYRLGLDSKDSSRVERAVEECTQAILLQSDHQRAYRLRGASYLTLGKLGQALADLNVAIALDPKDYLSLGNRGLVKVNKKQWDNALADYNESIRINPKQLWSYDNRGQLHAIHHWHDKAIADFNVFIHAQQDYAPVYLHRGRSWMLTERYRQAAEDFSMALRLQPQDNTARSYLGMTLFLLGKYTEAETEFRMVLPHRPHDMETRIGFYLTLAWQKKPTDEIFLGEDESLPSDTWPGVIFALMRNTLSNDAALDTLQKESDLVLRRERKNLILFLLGERALLNKRPADAKHWLQQIRLEHSYVPTLLHAAHHELRKLDKQPYTEKARREKSVKSSNQTGVLKATRLSDMPSSTPILGLDPKSGLSAEAVSEIDMLVARKVTRKSPVKGQFAIKLGSFKNTANADNALAEATRLGLPVYIEEVEVNKDIHMRVWLGPFKELGKAEHAYEKILALRRYKPEPVQKF